METKLASELSCNKIKSVATDGWLPRTAVPWTIQLKDELIAFFVKCDYPFRQIVVIPFEEPLRSEIRRFFISLDAYIDSPNPVIPYKNILYGAADIGYVTMLKNIRRKSFLMTWEADTFDYPDWWEKTPHYLIKDIGDIFNYSYLIFFKEEDPDDYKNGEIPVKIDEETLQKFKQSIRELLPDRNVFSKIEETEVLKHISASMSLDNNGEISPHYKIKGKFLKFAKRIGKVRRSVIRVSPGNTRDSVITNPAALNTISLIDKQVNEILSHMNDHIQLNNRDKVSKRIRKLADTVS